MGQRRAARGDRLLPSWRFLAAWVGAVVVLTALAWVLLPGWDAFSRSRTARVERGVVRRVEAAGDSDHLTIACGARTVALEVERPAGIYAPQAMREGDRVLVRVPTDGGEPSLGPRLRERSLLLCLAAFFIILGIAGGPRALRTALSLLAAFVLLVVVLVPLTVRGWDPVAVTLPLAAAIAAGTIYVVAGPNRKSTAALLGTLGGVVLALGVSSVATHVLALTGLSVEFGPHKAMAYRYWRSEAVGHIDFSRLLVAGLVISCLGAAMDVAISVATSVHEVVANRPSIPRRAAVWAGLSVGQAAVWMTAATLFFVLLGANLEPFLVRSLQHSASEWVRLVGFEDIATEVVRIGTAGLTMTLVAPLTALFSGLLLAGRPPGQAPDDGGPADA